MSTPQSHINVRALAAINLAASTEQTRYYLNGVKIEVEPRRTIYVATDARILAAWCEELTEPHGSAPGDPDNELCGSWIIPSEICKAYNVKRRDTDFAKLSVVGKELRIDSAQGAQIFSPINGQFPNWRSVVPTPAGKVDLSENVSINPELILRLMSVHAVLTDTKIKQVPKVYPTGDSNPTGDSKKNKESGTGPAIVRWSGSDLLGIAMPMRLMGGLNSLPEWFLKGPSEPETNCSDGGAP